MREAALIVRENTQSSSVSVVDQFGFTRSSCACSFAGCAVTKAGSLLESTGVIRVGSTVE